MHSGTSMLINVLKKHSMVYAVESELRLFDNHPGFFDLHKENIELYSKMARMLSLKNTDINFIESQREIIFETSQTVGQLVVQMIESLTAHNNNACWAEKTPTNVYFVDKIIDTFPDSKIILINRDVRSIIASKKIRTLSVESGRYKASKIEEKKLEKDWNVLADSLSWRGAIKSQEQAKKKYSDRVLEVQYEDFVTNPMQGWRRICDFIEVPFDENCLNIKFNNAAVGRSSASKGIMASSIDWKEILSKKEIILASTINRRALLSCGYSVESHFVKYAMMPLLVCVEIPGVLHRIVKRFKLFSFPFFFVYCKSLIKRI